MTPDDFLKRIDKQPLQPAYLFLGPESYMRERCRRALIGRALPASALDEGFTRFDLDETDLRDVIDDACSLSLFARERLIWAGSAEAALPRGRPLDEGAPGARAVSEFVRNPAPGVVVVFDCSRFSLEGEDKEKIQRVQKFYSAVSAQVEFAPLGYAAARSLAQNLAKEHGIQIGSGELELLVDVLGADASRIAVELEKLGLYAGGRKVTEQDIWDLAPNAKAATIFQLAAAIGRGERAASLEALEVLVREGEYLPLALSFLSTQLRMALVAKEAGLTTASQIQAHFTKLGTPMWRSRAEQVQQTLSAFSKERLRAAILETYATDKALRDTHPDDRIVVEQFVLKLTQAGTRAK